MPAGLGIVCGWLCAVRAESSGGDRGRWPTGPAVMRRGPVALSCGPRQELGHVGGLSGVLVLFALRGPGAQPPFISSFFASLFFIVLRPF